MTLDDVLRAIEAIPGEAKAFFASSLGQSLAPEVEMGLDSAVGAAVSEAKTLASQAVAEAEKIVPAWLKPIVVQFAPDATAAIDAEIEKIDADAKAKIADLTAQKEQLAAAAQGAA